MLGSPLNKVTGIGFQLYQKETPERVFLGRFAEFLLLFFLENTPGDLSK